MDDALYTGDLDLAAVTTPEELTTLLQIVHLRADKPSLRDLQARTRHRPTPLSRTVVSEMLRGMRTPRRAVMVSFLLACGVQDDLIDPWLRAWERIAGQQPTPAQNKATYVPHGGQSQVAADAADRSTSSVPLQKVVGAAQGRNASASVPTNIAVAVENANTARPGDVTDRADADNARLRPELAATDRQRLGRQPDRGRAANVRTARSPTVLRRELGALLRALRNAKGLTVEEVAERLLCSPSKVSRMETGHGVVAPRDIRDLCDLYGVTHEAERDRLKQLAREGKQQGWWQPYDLMYGTYIGLEAEAVAISAFQSSAVHGLLQTADYARALSEGAMPRLDPGKIDLQIEAKLTRQRILTQEYPPRFDAVLDEAALHRVIGGHPVMAAQLDKILDMSALPNVTVQILPFEHGAHPALESNFKILELPDPTPGIVYVEGLIGSIYLERPDDLERYHSVFGELQGIALSPEDSAEFLTEIIREHRTAETISNNSG